MTYGRDDRAGTYDIKAIKGNGNVSDDDAEILLNAIMGTSKDSLYAKTYKNVDFSEGITLTVTGVTIKLTPSK